MSLSLLRSRASQSVPGISQARELTRACSRPSTCRTTLPSISRTASRNLSDDKGASIDNDSQPTLASIQEIRLLNEFEKTKDIRDYLQKWHQLQTNTLDPVRGPGTSNSLDASDNWVGNMLNSNIETQDGGSDALRAADEDVADFHHGYEDDAGIRDILEPGDLVALTSLEGNLGFAIYVKSVSKQRQFYTDQGKWRIAFAKDIDYVVKGFATPEMTTQLHPHFPEAPAELSSRMQSAIEGGVPRSAGAHLLQMMGDFNDRVLEFYKANSLRLDRIHELVADENDLMEYTLEELACQALEIERDQVDEAIKFAVHKVIRRNIFLIENDRSSHFTNHYLVQPRRVARVLDNVTTWVHEHQNTLIRAAQGKKTFDLEFHPLQSFIQKARRLIRTSRKVRSPTTLASVGPTAVRFQPGQDGISTVFREVETEPFSSTDRDIIEFLQHWSIPPRRMTTGPLRSAGSHIMRATGLYNTLDLTAASVPLFLQELGVISPWENLRLLDQDLALPGHGISAKSDLAWANVQQAAENFGSEGITDTMESVRKDWGDLPVYCVDNYDAQEIDDGVSLERIPGSDDTFWIRVHVANPSAFVDPEDAIMKYASSHVQTVYTPERAYPMLPKPFAQDHFSLSSGRPTLTISAKMNLNGEVLDTDITNGTVRNVIAITHDKLRSLFEPVTENAGKTLRVGGKIPEVVPPKHFRDTLSSEDSENFHILRKLMLAFREFRLRNGAMDWPYSPDIPVSVSVGSERLNPYDMRVAQGRYFLGDPVIELRPQHNDPHEVADMSKRNLISLLMNMACWVSGKWCAERNIPTVYDGTYYHPEFVKLTRERMSEYGGANWLNFAAPKAISSSSPLHHVPLGLDSYVKSTSPLRRYTDLMSHYQIEAALRFEHEHGRRLDATTESAVLPFSRDRVDEFISKSAWRRLRIREVSTASRQFWGCMLLFRAFYFSECELPATYQCLVHKPYNTTTMLGTQYGTGYAGMITSLGLRCHVLNPPELEGIDILSTVEAKIISVDLSRMVVIMEATRLIQPFRRTGEWS